MCLTEVIEGNFYEAPLLKARRSAVIPSRSRTARKKRLISPNVRVHREMLVLELLRDALRFLRLDLLGRRA